MGNTRSLEPAEPEDIWWSNNSQQEVIVKCRDVKLDEFKLELARKHEKRRQLIGEKRKEMEELRGEVAKLRLENAALKQQQREVAPQVELQVTIASLQQDLEKLRREVAEFDGERRDYQAHVVALKDVVSVSKQMLRIREAQLTELRDKVKEIETSLASYELKAISQDLRKEYEKQLQNIRNLRVYYEERRRADDREREHLKSVLEETRKELEEERGKNRELHDDIQRLDGENSKKYDEIMNLESSLGLSKAECREYQAELAVINQLFSQILLGFNNNPDIDIENLNKLLEENHHLLQDIAINEESNHVSVLPKVLLDLVSEVNSKNGVDEDNKREEPLHQLNSASEIVENLPKVWKVLIELLSHQRAPISSSSPDGEKNENPCYNVVETPKGPNLVLSVSKTFIRLKDLILEKKSLERETGRLKNLNTHLETRLQEQEKRLETVSHELTETWLVVGKLQKKHQLLHTQEKILRYELAQKRKLLTELREQLEDSREKWQEAREKNTTTAKQWEQLRIEFAARKTHHNNDNNSVESGYSDDNKELSSSEEELEDASTTDIVGVIAEELVAIETSTTKTDGDGKSLDERLSEREERLVKLEGEASSLVKQVTNTTTRGSAISERLDELHEMYGSPLEEENAASGSGSGQN